MATPTKQAVHPHAGKRITLGGGVEDVPPLSVVPDAPRKAATGTPVEKAMETRLAERQRNREAGQREYAELLFRNVRGATPDDGERLLNIAGELGIDDNQIKTDIDLVKQFVKAEDRHAGAAGLRAEYDAARQATYSFNQETKRIVEERDKESRRLQALESTLQSRVSSGSTAVLTIIRLRNDRPQLFAGMRDDIR